MKLPGCILALVFAALAQNAPDAPDRKKLFEKKCGVCHASETTERRIGPSLKGINEGRLPGGGDATRDAILKQLNNGGNGMPVYRELLSDAEKDSLARYVLTL
jgi:mono/diheme cytochrome c family protein